MNDPYHIYMDLDVVNNEYNSTSKPHLRFEETRNTPFLPGDSADYFCSIVRFNIQTGNTIPVLIPKIQTGQNDINKTVYQVAIMFDYLEDATASEDKFGFANVMYSPEDETADTPAPPDKSQYVSSTYYFVYNYQHFIHLINIAIQNAWANLKDNFTSSGQGALFDTAVGNTIVPWIDFNPDTNRLFLNADDKLFNSELTSFYRMKLVFNDRMYELLASLPFRLISNQINLTTLQGFSERPFSVVCDQVCEQVQQQIRSENYRPNLNDHTKRDSVC